MLNIGLQFFAHKKGMGSTKNELTVSTLGAKALGLGITAVLGGAHTFFMGKELQTNVQHCSVPSFLIR